MPSCDAVASLRCSGVVMAVMPRPEDIMDEPADLEEHEEPNPIQDEAESDKVRNWRMMRMGYELI